MSSEMTNSYLTFKLGDEYFATSVLKVLNILEMTRYTKVPKSPVYMKGVINLRGAVLPLIDTRLKFDLQETEYTQNTCILVLEINLEGENVHVGAIVDSVQEVLEFEHSQIMPAPSIGSRYKSEYILGVVKHNDNFIMILNMDLIFSAQELSIYKDVAENENIRSQ